MKKENKKYSVITVIEFEDDQYVTDLENSPRFIMKRKNIETHIKNGEIFIKQIGFYYSDYNIVFIHKNLLKGFIEYHKKDFEKLINIKTIREFETIDKLLDL